MSNGLVWILLNNPDFKSFLISIGANATWEVVKKYVNNTLIDNSFECLLYSAINEAFRLCYAHTGQEYFEQQVMSEFIECVEKIDISTIRDINSNMVDEMVFATSNLKPADADLFVKCLIRVLSQNKYDMIRNCLQLEHLIVPTYAPNYDWMNDYMKGNWCKILVPDYEEVYDILEKVKTSLDSKTWKYIQHFIAEMIYNAQKHGHANKCKLRIDTNSVCIVDNGERFNPIIDLINQDCSGGGKYTLELVNSISIMNMDYVYRNSENQLKLIFENPCFDINAMSEIEISNLAFRVQAIYLHEGNYKYCFIDICKTLVNCNNRTSISGLYELIRFAEKLINKNALEQLFLFFDYVNTPQTEETYHHLSQIIKNRKDRSIIIVPEGQDI